jgi:hypothetical protein
MNEKSGPSLLSGAGTSKYSTHNATKPPISTIGLTNSFKPTFGSMEQLNPTNQASSTSTNYERSPFIT